MKRIIILLVLGLLSACQSLPSTYEGQRIIDTTISAMIANPGAYHGQIVRVRGVIDDCLSLGCGICDPDARSPKVDDVNRCFEIGWKDAESGEHGNQRLSDLMDETYRFSDVTLVAQFDASRSWRFNKNKPIRTPDGKDLHLIVCSDRCPELSVARVDTIHKRWSATESKDRDNFDWPLLVEAPAADAREIERVYSDSWQEDEKYSLLHTREHKVFVEPKSEPQPQEYADLCFCRGDRECENRWPKTVHHLIDSPNNPYWCASFYKLRGSWRLSLREQF